jgi:hypothetical protein
MDAIRASWRLAQAIHPVIATQERQLADRQRGAAVGAATATAAAPAVAAVAGVDRSANAAEARAGGRSSDGAGADAQSFAELHRQHELSRRDMELRMDQACDTEHEPPIPSVFEFEYGTDGRAYAVEPARHLAVSAEEAPGLAEVDSTAAAATEPVVASHDADVAVVASTRNAEPEPPARGSSAELSRSDMHTRAFVDREAGPQPGSRLDDTI